MPDVSFQIEFIRFEDGQAEAIVVRHFEETYPTIEDAITQGTLLLGSMQAIGAIGFRVIENGKVVAHRFVGLDVTDRNRQTP
jgi:hypothetical protein